MHKIVVDNFTKDKIISLYVDKGLSYQKISKEIGIPKSRVQNVISDRGLSRNSSNDKNALFDFAKLESMLEDGILKKDIAKYFGILPSTLSGKVRILKNGMSKEDILEHYNKMSKLNLSIREYSELFGIRRRDLSDSMARHNIKPLRNFGGKKYSLNSDYFEKIDTQEKAYWLGFIYADGCITGKNTFTMALARKDRVHLERFAECISFEGDVLDYTSKLGDKVYENSRVRFNDDKIFQDLLNVGVNKNKTYNISFPKWMPDHLLNHFVRGYFDGDGSVRKKNSSMAMEGDYDFLYEMFERFPFDITPNAKRRRPDCASISFDVSRRVDFDNMFEYMYSNSTIHLDRKKTIFENNYNRLRRFRD